MASVKSKDLVKIREFIPKDLESIQTAILYHHNSYYVGHLLKSSRKYGFYKNAATGSMLRMKWSDVLAILKTDFDSNILNPNEIIQGFLAFESETETFQRVFCVDIVTCSVKFDEGQLGIKLNPNIEYKNESYPSIIPIVFATQI